jgi:AsmA protein
VPTDWARQRVVARLSAASGRSVRLATLRIGAFGGIYLTGLEIGAPGAGDDPWLKVAQAHINVSPLQLLWGQVEPTETTVRGISLRILRRADGTLELDDLIRGTAAPAAPESVAATDHDSCPLSRLNLQIRDAQVTVLDVPTGTRLEFRDVAGRATSEGKHATIHELRGTLNGGPFEVVAQLDRSTPAPSFEGQIRAQSIALNQGMSILGYLVPVLSGDPASLDGTLEIDLYLRGQGTSRGELRSTLVGHGSVQLDSIELDGSPLLSELSSILELPEQARIGSISSDFAINRGRISSDNLTVDLVKLPIVLSGWTDFDGRANYRVRTDSVLDRLPSQARDLLSDLSVDVKKMTTLRVEGAIDRPTVTIDGVPLNRMTGRGDEPQASGDDHPKLRELGRRLRDRILR